MALMTQAAYARSRGVSKQAIGELKKNGKLKLVDGKIDSEYADRQLLRSLNPAKSKAVGNIRGDDGGEEDAPPKVVEMSEYQKERAATARIERMNAELDLEERRGTLIDRAGVLRALKEAGRALADQAMGIPRRVAPELANCGDPQRAEKQLEAEMRLLLEQFADTLIQRLEANQPLNG